jgi:hypothetical protein
MLVVPSLFFGGSMLSRLMQPLNALGKKKTSNAGGTPRVMVAMTSNTKGM